MDDERLHVLFFTSSLGGGGAEMHLLRVMNALDRSRFRVSVALAQAGGAYEDRAARDVHVHHLPTGRVDSSTLRMARAVLPLRRCIRRERPHVVCSMLGHANVAAALAVARLRDEPKLVLGVQNALSSNYADSWHPAKRFVFAVMPWLYPTADRVVALSRGVAEDLTALLPAVDRPEVIYNAGVDAEVKRKAEQSLPEETAHADQPLVVACGRLTEQKGFPFLLRAFARLREAVPARLRILGEGAEREHLERLTSRLGVATHVQMPGFVDNPYRHMAAADVFALSSLWEGFGNVVVEAMASGTATVATDCPHGPDEIIEHEKTGLLVPPSDVGALAQALRRLLTDEALRHQIAEAGRERAQDFSAECIADSYGNLFEEVVQHPEEPASVS